MSHERDFLTLRFNENGSARERISATEVRNLAQRSADASKDIKDLIRNSESKVSEGSSLVNESGTTLADIEEAVVKVSSMIEDITAGAEEQTSGIEQVNTAVAQMDEMTQQNAALVEEASASSAAVSEQATGLNKMMDFFIVVISRVDMTCLIHNLEAITFRILTIRSNNSPPRECIINSHLIPTQAMLRCNNSHILEIY